MQADLFPEKFKGKIMRSLGSFDSELHIKFLKESHDLSDFSINQWNEWIESLYYENMLIQSSFQLFKFIIPNEQLSERFLFGGI